MLIYNRHPYEPTAAPTYANRSEPPELIYALAEKSMTINGTFETTIAVDFGKQASTLYTGDVVQAAIKIVLTDEQVSQIGIGKLGKPCKSQPNLE